MAYLWIKSFHLLFVASWFAGLFYLPRIFVNLAMENEPAAQARLILMAQKLYRFMTILAIPALILGFALLSYIDLSGAGWFHAKMLVVVLILGYHHACGRLLKKFEQQANTKGHVFYRWFNEVPVLMMTAAIILVIVKPF